MILSRFFYNFVAAIEIYVFLSENMTLVENSYNNYAESTAYNYTTGGGGVEINYFRANKYSIRLTGWWRWSQRWWRRWS